MNSKLNEQIKIVNSETTKTANDSSLFQYSNFEEISKNYEHKEERDGSKIFEGYKEFEKEYDEEYNEKNIEKEKLKKLCETEGNFSEIYNPEERKENDIFSEYTSFLEKSEGPKIDIVDPPNLFDIHEPTILLGIQEYESYIEASFYGNEEASTDFSQEEEILLSPE